MSPGFAVVADTLWRTTRFGLTETVVVVLQFVLEAPDAQSLFGTTAVFASVVVPLPQPPRLSVTLKPRSAVPPAPIERLLHETVEPESAPPFVAPPNVPRASRDAMLSLTLTPAASALPAFWTLIV